MQAHELPRVELGGHTDLRALAAAAITVAQIASHNGTVATTTADQVAAFFAAAAAAAAATVYVP